jgi:hypothetical protein
MPPSSTAPPQAEQDLDQLGRSQALEDCLVDAGLPAELSPTGDGEARIAWADGHEVLARDSEQVTTLLEGPAGEIATAVHDAFTEEGTDALTGDLAPALWIDGKSHTDTWKQCLESSGYTNPTGYLEDNPEIDQVWAQRYTDAANDWIACARDNGLPALADAERDNDASPYGPHAEIPLNTGTDLLRGVVEACPIYNEDIIKRQMQGDPTLEDDIFAGRVAPIPLVLVEEPEGLQEAAKTTKGFDFESEEGRRYLELQDVLYKAGQELEEEYAGEQE